MPSLHTSLSPKTSSCPEADDTALATTQREATRQKRSHRASLQIVFWVGHDVSWNVRSRLTPQAQRLLWAKQAPTWQQTAAAQSASLQRMVRRRWARGSAWLGVMFDIINDPLNNRI